MMQGEDAEFEATQTTAVEESSLLVGGARHASGAGRRTEETMGRCSKQRSTRCRGPRKRVQTRARLPGAAAAGRRVQVELGELIVWRRQKAMRVPSTWHAERCHSRRKCRLKVPSADRSLLARQDAAIEVIIPVQRPNSTTTAVRRPNQTLPPPRGKSRAVSATCV